jgi:signal transduction histidine kinase
MKLKTRIFMSFFLIVLIPIFLMIMLLIGVAIFRGQQLRVQYGIDVNNLSPELQVIIADVIFSMIVILVITAIILSVWLYSGISTPLSHLTKATREIRDGNLDYEVKAEGAKEVKELCEGFEEMRMRLKAANEEKLEADRQHRELNSNISHDLKTPITAVKGYVEGIMDGIADTPEKMDRYIKTIYNKSIEMDHLINELTFYTKINTNRIPYTFSKVNVQNFFEDAAEELRYDLTSKNIAFDYQNTVGRDVQVIADVEQMRRVINNIVGNSVKYMDKPEKKISLRVRDAGEEIEAQVTDNGKGISSKDLGNIFNRFYRADSSRNSTQGGSGIGLSIVKKIMEDHGGRVWPPAPRERGRRCTSRCGSMLRDTEYCLAAIGT